MVNLAHMLAATARRLPLHPAMVRGADSCSYAELDDASARIAHMLCADGLAPGERVAVMVPSDGAFAEVYFGVLRAGGVAVPMNPRLAVREVEHYLVDSGARWLFVATPTADTVSLAWALGIIVVDIDAIGPELAGCDPLHEIVARHDDDIAVILYTAGVTGAPKGAALTHANLARNAEIVADRLCGLGEHDVVLGCLPLFHSFGLTCVLNAAVRNGACVVTFRRFEAGEVLDLLDRHGVTVMVAVPTIYALLLAASPRDRETPGRLRLCVSGGSPLTVDLLFAVEERFGCELREGYGMTEASPVVTFNHPDRARKPGSVGTPIDGVEIRIIDGDGNPVPRGEIGELVVRGHNVMAGYWRRESGTAEAVPEGWLRSGDLAIEDADGAVTIVGRIKDVILRAGFKVHPREIEEVLHQHPAVEDCAAVPIPHQILGEEVGVAVVVRPGAFVSIGDLREFVRDRTAPYKWPNRMWFVVGLPKDPSGKPLRRQIRIPGPLSR